MRELRERVAVVTGGASGIGRALGRRLGDEGMRVVLADVEEAALRAAAADLEARRVSCLAVPTDVTDPQAVDALARRAVDAFGAVHLVCNNAGVFAGGAAWKVPAADWRWVFDVNVMGVVHGIRSFVPGLVARGEGHVVNTASMAALTTPPFTAPYVASKHAVLALSECLAQELAGTGVGVSVVCPEAIATAIADSDRNRPAHAPAEADAANAPERRLVEEAMRAATAAGLSPDVIADRVVGAVREGRFWALPPAEDAWWKACEARLGAVRQRRAPGFQAPE